MSKEKKKILIVEDEKAMLEAISTKLEKSGYTVVSANDGEKGIEIAKQEKPDLMMLDIIMPKFDGLTVMKKVREEGGDWGLNVPIIMLTNLSDPESVAEAAKYQVYDFLVKTDWKLDDIVDLVDRKVA